jgi:hypothetical protein
LRLGLSCPFGEQVFVLAVADDEHPFPSRSPMTNSKPVYPGSMVISDTEPSSFVREPTALRHSPTSNTVRSPARDTRSVPSSGLR